MALRKVNPGDAVRASDYNALVDAVLGLLGSRGGPGLRVGRTTGGLTLGLSDDRFGFAKEGRITRVYRDGQPWLPDGKAQDPLRITYAARPMRADPEAEVLPAPWGTGWTGYLNRPNTRGTVTVFPALVGAKCWIWRTADAEGAPVLELEVLTEEIEFVAKCSDGKGPGGGDGEQDPPDGDPDPPDEPGGMTPSVGLPGLPGDTGGPGSSGTGPGGGFGIGGGDA